MYWSKDLSLRILWNWFTASGHDFVELFYGSGHDFEKSSAKPFINRRKRHITQLIEWRFLHWEIKKCTAERKRLSIIGTSVMHTESGNANTSNSRVRKPEFLARTPRPGHGFVLAIKLLIFLVQDWSFFYYTLTNFNLQFSSPFYSCHLEPIRLRSV